MKVVPLDLSQLKVFALAERRNLTTADDILIDPDAPPQGCSERNAAFPSRVWERGSSLRVLRQAQNVDRAITGERRQVPTVGCKYQLHGP